MSDFYCVMCRYDLELWNFSENLIHFCPNCGAKLPNEQRDALHRKTTDEDIDDHVRGSLLDMFDNYGSELRAEELAECAWESENANGVVFCSNYEADRFVMRHTRWVDEALEYISDNFGGVGHYIEMKAECNDRFLVVVFIEATRKYLYDQLGIDQNEDILSEERVCEIKELIKENPYNCEW